jgi:hypothetical protein
MPAPTAASQATSEGGAHIGATVSLVGAGDIASCTSSGDEATALLLDVIPGTVVLLGDNAYDQGTLQEYTNCYDPSWGRAQGTHQTRAGESRLRDDERDRLLRVLRNGSRRSGERVLQLQPRGLAHCRSQLESGLHGHQLCHRITARPVAAGRPHGQPEAVYARLLASPRFNSGEKGNNTNVLPFWQVLFAANADIVLNGHEHMYERFAPQTPAGVANAARGIRQFTVGTGGDSHALIKTVQPNSEVRETDTFGVLQLTLKPTSYDWQFIPVAGSSFVDSGTGTCH